MVAIRTPFMSSSIKHLHRVICFVAPSQPRPSLKSIPLPNIIDIFDIITTPSQRQALLSRRNNALFCLRCIREVSGYNTETIKTSAPTFSFLFFPRRGTFNLTLNASANEQRDRWRGEKEACLFCGLRESHSTHTASSLAPQGAAFSLLK